MLRKKQLMTSKLFLNNFRVKSTTGSRQDDDESDFKALEEAAIQETLRESFKKQRKQEDYRLEFPEKYHNDEYWNASIRKQLKSKDGKIQTIYESGKIEVVFPHKVTKQVFPDNYTIVYFFNKDIKQKFPDGKLVYYFAEVDTTQTTMPDGLQIFRFTNNQIEKHYNNGNREIIFADGTTKLITEDEEISTLTEGTIHRVSKDEIQTIENTNGEKEITYPNGRVLKEYPDGRIEEIN